MKVNGLSSILDESKLFSKTQQYHCTFAYRLQTQKEKDEETPPDTTQLQEVELKDHPDNGIVNPGMETRTKCLFSQ